MGVSAAAAAEAIGSYFTADAAAAAGADAIGSLTASDLALTAGIDGASAATAATAGDAAAAGFMGTGFTGSQLLTGAQAGLGAANLATTLMTPRASLTAPSAPGALPQAAQSPNASAISAGLAGAGQAGGSPGVAQTLLTGANGVDPNSLNLGKNTLLGS